MLSVTTLSGYLYCPRKTYLQYVFKLAPPPKSILTIGKIKHEVFDYINRIDEKIVTSITEPIYQNILDAYKKNYGRIIKTIIEQNRDEIEEIREISETKLNEDSIFKEIELLTSIEAETRAENLSRFTSQTKLFGPKLWASLTPKYITELEISSKEYRLKGRIDRLEISKENDVYNYIPIEIKTGAAPPDKIWDSDRIQLIAYLCMLKKHFAKKDDVKVISGCIYYLGNNKKRNLIFNPFIEIELKLLLNKVFTLLESKTPPEKANNKNKCEHCGLKEQCFKLP